MPEEEAQQQIARTDAFIADFRELIASTVVDPASPCEAACRRGLERIGDTVDAVDYVTFANLANLNCGGLLDLIEVQLKCVGGGPDIGLSGRGGIPSRVPAGDRCGIKPAPAIRDRSMTIASRGVLLLEDTNPALALAHVGGDAKLAWPPGFDVKQSSPSSTASRVGRCLNHS